MFKKVVGCALCIYMLVGCSEVFPKKKNPVEEVEENKYSYEECKTRSTLASLLMTRRMQGDSFVSVHGEPDHCDNGYNKFKMSLVKEIFSINITPTSDPIAQMKVGDEYGNMFMLSCLEGKELVFE